MTINNQGSNYWPCRPCHAGGPRTQGAQAGTTQNIKKFCELSAEAEMGMEGQIMCIEQCTF